MTLNNSEEYDDPILYDKENDQSIPELNFLSAWASKKKGPIIDLACGTGRLTIPLAKSGYTLIGADIHKGMLNEARKKASALSLEIEWLEQDCTKLHVPIKSHLIYSVGNSFQHFLTNESQDGLLSSVNKHLEKDGVFIFGTRFPSAEELLQPASEEYWRTYTDRETLQTVDVYTISSYDSLNQIQHYTTIRKYKNKESQLAEEKRTHIQLRYVYPKEMERTLSANGLEIIHIYKDWKETPADHDSFELIYVCKKSR